MRPFDPAKIPQPNGDFTDILKQIERAPLVDIEIGCGVGMHPIQYSTANPERLLIAMERTKEKSRKFQNSLKTGAYDNLIALHTDAINWISHFIASDSVDRYFILYPNPYPKKRQANQRFANMPFMAHLISTLKPGGTITMATNINEYALEASQILTETWGLSLDKQEELSDSFTPRTHFEKKYLERGDLCINLLFTKT